MPFLSFKRPALQGPPRRKIIDWEEGQGSEFKVPERSSYIYQCAENGYHPNNRNTVLRASKLSQIMTKCHRTQMRVEFWSSADSQGSITKRLKLILGRAGGPHMPLLVVGI